MRRGRKNKENATFVMSTRWAQMTGHQHAQSVDATCVGNVKMSNARMVRKQRKDTGERPRSGKEDDVQGKKKTKSELCGAGTADQKHWRKPKIIRAAERVVLGGWKEALCKGAPQQNPGMG